MPNAKSDQIAQLIRTLAEPAPRANAAGDALLTACEGAPRPLLQAMQTSPPAIRRRLAFLLGKINAGRDQGDVRAALLETLANDADAKVRKNSAVSLGTVGTPAQLDALKQALMREVDAPTRASIVLAVGKFASADDLPWLHEWAPETPREQQAKATVIAHLGASQSAADLDTEAPLDEGVELWARRGLSKLLAREAKKHALSVRIIDQARVAVVGASTIAQLLKPRIALHPVIACTLDVPPHEPALAGRRFTTCSVANEMRRLTRTAKVVYRLSMNASIKGFARRRDWFAQFAETATTEDFTNSATGYAWEVIVKPDRKGLQIAARPAAAEDDRFAYRRQDIPAALHPTLAAAAAAALPADAQDIVVDPFCGSGTLLAERAMRGPYQRLIGFDHYRQALNAARANLSEITKGTQLERADFQQANELGPVHQIITNPPYGRRVGSAVLARKLHASLDDLAERILAPRGYLAVFRPLAFAGPRQLRVVQRIRIDAGGIPIQLWIAQKSGA